MAYSTSRETLDRILHLLRPLCSPRALEHQWEPEDDGSPNPARRLAVQLREGLSIARLFPSLYPDLVEATSDLQIVVRHRLLVGVRLRPSRRVAMSHREAPPTVLPAYMQPEMVRLANEGAPTATAMLADLETVKARWINASKLGVKKITAQVNFVAEDLLALFEWTQEQDIVFFEASGNLTLKVPDEADRELAWNPSDLESPNE